LIGGNGRDKGSFLRKKQGKVIMRVARKKRNVASKAREGGYIWKEV